MGVLLFYFLVYFELFRRRIRVKPLGTTTLGSRALPFSIRSVEQTVKRIARKYL